MLSLVGSIQPDPFSPEHTPQVKPDQAQSPQSPPHSVLPDPVESDAIDDEELDSVTARLSPAASDEGERRGEMKGNEGSLATKGKGGTVTKSKHRQKRRKAS